MDRMKPGDTMMLLRGPRAGITATVERVIGEGAMQKYTGWCAELEGKTVTWSASAVCKVTP